jgi:hypothetical protein
MDPDLLLGQRCMPPVPYRYSRSIRGEVLFKQYLARCGYRDYEYEAGWLHPPKKPDFLLKTAPFAMQTHTKTPTPIRRAMSHAVEQMKGIEGRPLVDRQSGQPHSAQFAVRHGCHVRRSRVRLPG